MPWRRKKKYNKKRRYRKRATAPVRSLMKSPMPRRYMTKLRYADTGLTVNPGIGTVATYTFRANSLFDPDYTSTGHQPRGFDQLMPLFNHYTVLGSKITVTCNNDDENDSLQCFLALQGETFSGDKIDLLERQDIRSCVLAGKGSGTTCKTLVQKFSAKRFFGPKNPMDDTDQRGSISSSPSELAYFHFGVCSLNGSTDPSAVPFTVSIDYIVMFHEPNDVSSS